VSILLKRLNRADNKYGKTIVAGKALMYHRIQEDKKLKTLYFALRSAKIINRKLLVGKYLILNPPPPPQKKTPVTAVWCEILYFGQNCRFKIRGVLFLSPAIAVCL
jgi:hypothetical protein